MKFDFLNGLKTELLRATDFRQVFDQFFDELDEFPEFLSLGEAARDPVLEAAIRVAAGQTEEDSLQNLLLIRLAAVRFVHGGFTVGEGLLGCFFYFEDVRTGLAAVSDATGHTRIARLSISEVALGPFQN